MEEIIINNYREKKENIIINKHYPDTFITKIIIGLDNPEPSKELEVIESSHNELRSCFPYHYLDGKIYSKYLPLLDKINENKLSYIVCIDGLFEINYDASIYYLKIIYTKKEEYNFHHYISPHIINFNTPVKILNHDSMSIAVGNFTLYMTENHYNNCFEFIKFLANGIVIYSIDKNTLDLLGNIYTSNNIIYITLPFIPHIMLKDIPYTNLAVNVFSSDINLHYLGISSHGGTHIHGINIIRQTLQNNIIYKNMTSMNIQDFSSDRPVICINDLSNLYNYINSYIFLPICIWKIVDSFMVKDCDYIKLMRIFSNIGKEKFRIIDIVHFNELRYNDGILDLVYD